MLQQDTIDEPAPGIQRALGGVCGFEGLTASDFQAFASRSQMVSVECGKVLFESGDCDPWVYLLLDGELSLTTRDGCEHRLVGGTPAAGQIVSRLKPRLHTATACGSATLLRIDGNPAGYWHSCVDGPISRWEKLSDAGYLRDRGEACAKAVSTLEVPAMPEIALKARALLERDECNVQAVAQLLVEDPTMVAKLVRVANSPLFYGAQVATTCEQAIVRLGLKSTRFMIIAFAVRRLFDIDAPEQSHLVRELWEHSTEVAAITSVLARRLVIFDPGEAQLAGLLHDVGVIPFLDAASRNPVLGGDPEGLMALISGQRAAMGRHTLERWNFSPGLIASADEADSWHRDPKEPPDLADLVVVAQLLSFIGKRRIRDASLVLDLPAFRKILGATMSPGQVLDFLDEHAGAIEEVRSLLRS